MATFVRSYPVRFEDCDAAGIVFYPRLFLVVNRVVEDWFADALGVDFRTLHLERGLGIPTVEMHVRFLRAIRLGDRLDVALELRRLGSRAFTLGIDARCNDEACFAVESVLVCADLVDDGISSRTLPDDLRERMAVYLAPGRDKTDD
jgi:4-hydroxybenzoyl-CoA thioesterase